MTSKHRLTFATVEVVQPDMVEIVIDGGVEVTIPMVEEWHAFLAQHMPARCAILVNKLNSYSYSYGAQELLGTSPQIGLVAVVVYSKTSAVIVRGIARTVAHGKFWQMELFDSREDALAWLQASMST